MAIRKENVRSLVRGLKVLRHINSVGETKASHIARELDIPRSTVYRLLHTLEEEGYITFSGSDNRVRVALDAVSLGDNYQSSHICQLAAPILNEYTNKNTWPIDLSLYENGHMIIQETTHQRSSLSIDRGMIGYRLPMLRSSAGRAYLAFCDENSRQIILKHIRKLDVTEDLAFLDEATLRSALKFVQKNGYATRSSKVFRSETASLAVPILKGREVVACVSTIWIDKAMTMKDAVGQYEQPLKQVAEEIAEMLEAKIGTRNQKA